MVKKFVANCDFNGQKYPITLYVGNPAKGSHPLGFQSKWLAKNRSGKIPEDIMDAFSRIAEIAEKHRVAFEELCSYVINELNESDSFISDFSQASEFSNNGIDYAKDVNDQSWKKNDEYDDEDYDEDDEDDGDDRFTKKSENESEETKFVDQLSNDLLEAQEEDNDLDQEEEEVIEIDPDNHEKIYLDKNYGKKPKKFKEAPIADDGLQPALKSQRNDKRFNPFAKSAEQKDSPRKDSGLENVATNSFSFYKGSQSNEKPKDIKTSKVEPVAKSTTTIDRN